MSGNLGGILDRTLGATTGEGKHVVPGDRSFSASLLGHVLTGAGLVALVATAFWAIGQFGRAARSPVVAKPADLAVPPRAAAPPAPDTSTFAVAPPAPVPPPAAAAAPQAVAAAPPAPAPPPAPLIPPGDIRVQILDGTGDSGAKVKAAAAKLQGDGYDLVAVNPAIREYDTSIIYYTPGHEAEARQIAAQYPMFGSIREKPSSLSSSVGVHLIIGRDFPVP